MRLIHSTRLELHEFFGSDVPKYANLSHCWAKDEVTYQDFLSGAKRNGDGWQKILECCKIASRNHLDWAWVDTCCIDKSKDAELSEAIRSMYRWYKQAEVCYAFLLDYCCAEEYCSDLRFSLSETKSIPEGAVTKLADSRWFTRGWTLQELLAPERVLFFDCTGAEFGSKTDLAETLSTITRIEVAYLRGEKSITAASVSCRMSWASERETTREEDIAYCLLGLFETSMDMQYGEGVGAVQRLQEKIIENIDDHTLFAWRRSEIKIPRIQKKSTPSQQNKLAERSSILARSPIEFSEGAFFVRLDNELRPCQIQSIGIQVWQNLWELKNSREDFETGVKQMLCLACRDTRWTNTYDKVMIELWRSRAGGDGRVWHRTQPERLFQSNHSSLLRLFGTRLLYVTPGLVQLFVNRSEDIFVQRAQSAD